MSGDVRSKQSEVQIMALVLLFASATPSSGNSLARRWCGVGLKTECVGTVTKTHENIDDSMSCISRCNDGASKCLTYDIGTEICTCYDKPQYTTEIVQSQDQETFLDKEWAVGGPYNEGDPDPGTIGTCPYQTPARSLSDKWCRLTGFKCTGVYKGKSLKDSELDSPDSAGCVKECDGRGASINCMRYKPNECKCYSAAEARSGEGYESSLRRSAAAGDKPGTTCPDVDSPSTEQPSTASPSTEQPSTASPSLSDAAPSPAASAVDQFCPAGQNTQCKGKVRNFARHTSLPQPVDTLSCLTWCHEDKDEEIAAQCVSYGFRDGDTLFRWCMCYEDAEFGPDPNKGQMALLLRSAGTCPSDDSSIMSSLKLTQYTEGISTAIQDLTSEAVVDGQQKSKTTTTSLGRAHVSVKKVSSEALSQGSSISAGDAEAILPGEVAGAAKLEENEVTVVVIVKHADTVKFLDKEDKITRMDDLGSKAVNLTVTAVNTKKDASRTIEVANLSEPISITMNITERDVALMCAAWDEDLQKWSTDGMSGGAAAGDTAETVTCQSTHLTTFALVMQKVSEEVDAVVEEVEAVVSCSNFHIWSEYAFDCFTGNSEDDFWLLHPVGLLWLFYIILAVVLLVSATLSDAQAQRQHRWGDDSFLVDASAPEKDEEKHPLKEKLAMAALVALVNQSIAAEANVHVDDMKVALHKHVTKHGVLQSKDKKPDGVVEHFFTAEHLDQNFVKKALYANLHSSLGTRVGLLFLSLHPILALKRYSVIVPHKVRTLLFLGSAFGSLLVTALFFTSSGETVSVRDPDECGEGRSPILRAIVTGVCSALISSIFIFVLSRLHNRGFVYCGEWSAEKKKKLLTKWRMLDVCLMVWVVFYLCFCILFVGLFLSQVSNTDKSAFLVSTVVAIFEGWVIVPLIQCTVEAVLSGRMNPNHPLMKQIEKQLGLNAEDIEQLTEDFKDVVEDADSQGLILKATPHARPPESHSKPHSEESYTKNLEENPQNDSHNAGSAGCCQNVVVAKPKSKPEGPMNLVQSLVHHQPSGASKPTEPASIDEPLQNGSADSHNPEPAPNPSIGIRVFSCAYCYQPRDSADPANTRCG